MIGIQFRNIEEIRKHYQNQINSGNRNVLNDIKTKDGKNYDEVTDDILFTEAEELRKCIQAQIDEYYNKFPESKSPAFARTDGLKTSLKVESIIQKTSHGKFIGLYFDSTNSWGKSFISDDYPGWKPWLINDGWKVHKPVNFKNTYHVGYYEGFNFIERGIADWKSESKFAKNINVRRIAGYEIINM